MSFKVIEFGANREPVINSNLDPISQRYWDTATYHHHHHQFYFRHLAHIHIKHIKTYSKTHKTNTQIMQIQVSYWPKIANFAHPLSF